MRTDYKKVKKLICQYCQDVIVGRPKFIERKYRTRKGYNTYKSFPVDIGCYMLLVERGSIDEVFGEDAENCE